MRRDDNQGRNRESHGRESGKGHRTPRARTCMKEGIRDGQERGPEREKRDSDCNRTEEGDEDQ